MMDPQETNLLLYPSILHIENQEKGNRYKILTCRGLKTCINV